MNQIGRSLPRLEARDKVTGRAEYIHHFRLPGILHGKIFRSAVAHGRIKRIDTRAAAALPGVYRVFTIDDILAQADGLMVARGDLGVEIPLQDVPRIQRDLLARCNHAGKPAITATQMLESMVTSGRPTRAEATDVHVAVTGLTDAVMLSAETASGRFPVEAVTAMRAIATAAERVL